MSGCWARTKWCRHRSGTATANSSPRCTRTRRTNDCSHEIVCMRLPDHIAAKSLAVLAAVCFVIAFAMANLLPTVTQLGRLVTMTSPAMLPAVHDFLHAYHSEWMWDWLLVPLLLR